MRQQERVSVTRYGLLDEVNIPRRLRNQFVQSKNEESLRTAKLSLAAKSDTDQRCRESADEVQQIQRRTQHVRKVTTLLESHEVDQMRRKTALYLEGKLITLAHEQRRITQLVVINKATKPIFPPRLGQQGDILIYKQWCRRLEMGQPLRAVLETDHDKINTKEGPGNEKSIAITYPKSQGMLKQTQL